MTIPISTYRLQVRADFDLDAAAGIVDYLHDLGADWIYLSPILAATSGSDHGYDVVDHSVIDASRGGPDALVRLARAAHAHSMGIIVDIVPNHVGVATPVENRWWWELLRDGTNSRYAEAFDVDWAAGDGRVLVPVLSDESVVTVVDAGQGDARLDGAQLDVSGLRLPLRDGTDPSGPIETVLAHQHYELIHWSRADTELNYRRFFSVTTLAGIRVEVPWVFDESHREIRRWFDDGLVDGLRVDHPDGLFDPGAYLDDLAEATGDAFVLVEKILASDEELPSHWAAAGTTGYDALAELDRVLVDPAGRGRLLELEAKLAGGEREPWAELTHRTRRRVADEVLRAEILRIARAFGESPERDLLELADAIAEVTACFPVYRSYLPYGREHLDQAVAEAAARRPDLTGCLERIHPVLADPGHPAAQRLQQTTGMVMAKGVEDKAFYRFGGLVSLTEVGGDPSEFALDIAEFHERQARRQAAFPASLTALTTHDTKRSEDVRARVNVLSEVVEEWAGFLAAVRRIVPLGSGDADHGALENVLWETIIGSWPASRERLQAYAEKAAREAGTSTSWTQPNESFERRVHALVDAAFDDAEVASLVRAMSDRITPHGWSNSLAAKLIQLTSPGVPDVYQGTELWDRSLVDPDNRRMVDFDERRRMLAELDSGILSPTGDTAILSPACDSGILPPIDDSGLAKLLVTSRALRLRRDRQELFTRYLGITALGEAADHVIAFDRGGAVAVATRLSVSLAADGGWGDTSILLPHRDMVDVITGATFEGGAIEVAALLARYPVALLAPID